jgi:hypothetical protein
MKKIIFIFLFFSTLVNAQEEFMQIIADESCECLKKKNIKVDKEEVYKLAMEFGVCVMASYNSNLNIIPENKKIVLSNYDEGRKFGKEIAKYMLKSCPDYVISLGIKSLENEDLRKKIIENYQNKDEFLTDTNSIEVDSTNFLVNGTFTGSIKETHFFINLKEETGKTHKFALLNNFENSFLITDDILKISEKISVEYFEAELFDKNTFTFVKTKIIVNINKN